MWFTESIRGIGMCMTTAFTLMFSLLIPTVCGLTGVSALSESVGAGDGTILIITAGEVIIPVTGEAIGVRRGAGDILTIITAGMIHGTDTAVGADLIIGTTARILRTGLVRTAALPVRL